MEHQVRVSANPNGGRRVHKPRSILDLFKPKDKRTTIENAREIAKRVNKKAKGDTIRCARNPFPPRHINTTI